MIEINLLPGSVKRTKRKAPSLSAGPLAKIKLPKIDKFLAIAIGMWAASLLLIVWMQFTSAGALNTATLNQAALERDTVRLHNELKQNETLLGKQDTIAARLAVIQELDAGRYDWAHILDDINNALPDYMWLIAINPSPSDDPKLPGFKIEGRMANAFALPQFMTDLEKSPFIANVEIKSSGTVTDEGKSVYAFVLEATYEQPSNDQLRTEPLFGKDAPPDSALSASVTTKMAATPPATTTAKPPASTTKPPVKPPVKPAAPPPAAKKPAATKPAAKKGGM